MTIILLSRSSTYYPVLTDSQTSTTQLQLEQHCWRIEQTNTDRYQQDLTYQPGTMMLTIIWCCNNHVCSRPTSLTVTGKDRAVVGGGWYKSSQCEGACCSVLHGNTVPTIGRDTGEEVASDHSMLEVGSRRGPRECHVPCSGSDCETLWWASRG